MASEEQHHLSKSRVLIVEELSSLPLMPTATRLPERQRPGRMAYVVKPFTQSSVKVAIEVALGRLQLERETKRDKIALCCS